MKLKLERKIFTKKSTIGELFVNDIHECWVLEDTVRNEKIKGETAIPYGTYTIVIDWSNRFQRQMPHLLDVVGFEGVRIHQGNTDKSTEGCLLVGRTYSTDFIGNSKQAFNELFPKLKEAFDKKEDITINIRVALPDTP